jgi:hypothetical protein
MNAPTLQNGARLTLQNGARLTLQNGAHNRFLRFLPNAWRRALAFKHSQLTCCVLWPVTANIRMLPALLVCIVAHKSIFGVTFTMPREGQPLQALSFDLLLLVVFDTQCYEDALCPFLSAHCRTFVLQLQCLVKGTVLSEEGFFSSLIVWALSQLWLCFLPPYFADWIGQTAAHFQLPSRP